ncbi:MAG: glycosyltransferase involved in cell wall biosynthesis [Patiriisocius sp.]|jgi:glycosyltransferase involved in cell wall biosynthesis
MSQPQSTIQIDSLKKIAFTIEELSVGGAEKMLVTIANDLAALDWQVHLVCLKDAGELATDLDERVCLRVLNKKPGADFSLLWKLNRCLTELDPICVNSHLCVANTWTRTALALSSIPVVATEHSRDTWKPGYYRKIDRVLSYFSAALVAVSGDTADFYETTIGVKKSLIHVINNGVDTEIYAKGAGAALRTEWLGEVISSVEATHSAKSNADNLVLLGTVGRMITAKNHQRLIDALYRLVHDKTLEYLSLKLVFVGDGPERQAVESYTSERGLTDYVIFTGTRHDIPDVLEAFDVFVLSSDREGHPLTALEAQAAGTSVVLTDAGGSADAIAYSGNEVGGVLVDRCDEALAEALKELLINPEKRKARARFGQQFALANFDKRHMVTRYVELFESVGR